MRFKHFHFLWAEVASLQVLHTCSNMSKERNYMARLCKHYLLVMEIMNYDYYHINHALKNG